MKKDESIRFPIKPNKIVWKPLVGGVSHKVYARM